MKARIGIFCSIFLVSVFLLCTLSFAVTPLQTQGTVTKVENTVIFLKQSGETSTPFYLGAASVLKGVSPADLQQLEGKSVSITYRVMGSRNLIEALEVAQ
jgi:hypothetical protein